MTISPCLYPRCVDRDGNATLTGDGICTWCRDKRVARDLNAAPTLYTQLRLAVVPGKSKREDKVSGSRTPAVPLVLAMLDQATRLFDALQDWADVVRVAAQLAPRPAGHTREGWSVNTSVALLLPRLDQACAVAPTLAVELGAETQSARGMLQITRLVHRLDVPCPDCDLKALVREDGAAYIRCRACGACWAEELYQSLARVIAAEYEQSW